VNADNQRPTGNFSLAAASSSAARMMAELKLRGRRGAISLHNQWLLASCSSVRSLDFQEASGTMPRHAIDS
jgi:hypothetical protein